MWFVKVKCMRLGNRDARKKCAICILNAVIIIDDIPRVCEYMCVFKIGTQARKKRIFLLLFFFIKSLL